MNSAFLSLFALLLVAVAAQQNTNPDSGSGTSRYNCPENEEFSSRGKFLTCQGTCETRGVSRTGILCGGSYGECVCQDGFVRAVRGGRCIPINECDGPWSLTSTQTTSTDFTSPQPDTTQTETTQTETTQTDTIQPSSTGTSNA